MNIVSESAVERKSSANSVAGKPLPSCWTQSQPGEEATSREAVFEASQKLVAAGLSIIPIEAYEGSKAPDSLRLPHHCDPVDGRRKPSWAA
jgi:hypothetical protein